MDPNRRKVLQLLLGGAVSLSGCGFFFDIKRERRRPSYLDEDLDVPPRRLPPPKKANEENLISALKDFIYANYDGNLFGRRGKIPAARQQLEIVLQGTELGLQVIDELDQGKVPESLVNYFKERGKVFRGGPSDMKFSFELRNLKDSDEKYLVLWGVRKDYVLDRFDKDFIMNPFDYSFSVTGAALGRVLGKAIKDEKDTVDFYMGAARELLGGYFKSFGRRKEEIEKELADHRLLDKFIGARKLNPTFYTHLGEMMQYSYFGNEFNDARSLDDFVYKTLPFIQRDLEVHECQHLIDSRPPHCDLSVTKMHAELRCFLTEMKHANPRRPMAASFNLMAVAGTGLVPEYYHRAAGYLVRFVCQIMAKRQNRRLFPNVDYSRFNESPNAIYLMEQIPGLKDNQLEGAAKTIFKHIYQGKDFDSYMRTLRVERKGR
ncbi:hypothetical protein ACFLZB_02170 [Nanoarchaeota archaeon]